MAAPPTLVIPPAPVRDRQIEEIVAQSATVEQFEKTFLEVLSELDGQEALDGFRKEYETLHLSFLKSHESEKRLLKKCQDLLADVSSCQNKVCTAEELSAGDEGTIDTLRKEIAKARTKFEASNAKEVTSKEKIKLLRAEIKDLETQLKKGVSGLIGHDAAITELSKVRDDLVKERDTQNMQLAAIRQDITEYKARLDKLQAEKDIQETELLSLKRVIEMKQRELDEQKKRKEDWEHELKTLKTDLTIKGHDIQDRNLLIQNSMNAIMALDDQLLDQKTQTEMAIREYELINAKTQKYQQELEEEIQKNSQILADNQNLNAQMKLKDSEISQVRAEVAKQQKLRDAVLQRIAALEQSKDEVEAETSKLRRKLQDMETENANAQKACENDRKQIDDLTRERDLLNKNYLKAQGSTSKQSDWILIKQNQKRNLEQEIYGFDLHAQDQRDLIYQMQRETEAYEKDAEEHYQKYMQVVKFTGKEEYEAGDVSREAARRVKALVANAQQLSALVKDTVREYTGKDHYEFGDLTVALDQRVKDAVAGILEKDSYEVGDLTRVIDKVVKQEIETVTGRPYQFGDLSRALGSRLQGAVSGFTGKEEYRPGDLLQEAGKRLTGRADYQVGDLTKGLLSNLFKKKDP